ncbi:MAG: hypothetical protein HQL38_07500 [Alphaproteobacteria bacterium]|nr:hypothetical protein [Alphaproteobacteria bacterium]
MTTKFSNSQTIVQRQQYKAIKLGAVPVDLVNKALGRTLVEGRAKLSALAHQHIAQDHPTDYALVMRALRSVLDAPDYVGHDGFDIPNFYFVRAVSDGAGQAHVLVAIAISPSADGCYRVRSAYSISPATVANRLGANPPRLHRV